MRACPLPLLYSDKSMSDAIVIQRREYVSHPCNMCDERMSAISGITSYRHTGCPCHMRDENMPTVHYSCYKRVPGDLVTHVRKPCPLSCKESMSAVM
ncbi:hypothetical protein NDU88_000898 [Pleurodeles waltl]|uniref:Uncharacterized protein n=1 Tax=Pleurodeles waltl TaxID=8319 RepID=A0AAV7MT59_PLEWA|nr:hypothetical protein NDU88_000898 [Pleurodeles waltl]